jgi:type IV pilus assembly protein PilV
MYINQARSAGARSQRGDTMIEVLVTIIIIAVGVLGTAALQVTTLKNLSTSHSTSIAAMLADDLGERMRSNPDAANDYVHKGNVPDAFSDCAANACTDTQLAQYDLGTWWQDATAVLPALSTEVRQEAGVYRIFVYWDEDRSGSTGKACPPQSDADMECFTIDVTI